LGVLVAGIATVALQRRNRSRQMLRSGTVEQATGPVMVQRVRIGGDNDLDWRLTLGDLRFDLTTEGARGFFALGAYTLYHVTDQSAPTLLAAEPAPHRPLSLRQAWPRADWAEVNAAGELSADQRALLLGTAPGPGARLLVGLESVLVTALVIDYAFAPAAPAVVAGFPAAVARDVPVALAGRSATAALRRTGVGP
jgi:hypothetical protein